MRTLLVSALAIGLLLSLTACAPASQASPLLESPQPQVPVSETPTQVTPTITLTPQEVEDQAQATATPVPDTSDELQQRMVRLSKEHLSRKLGIDVGQIVPVEVRAVEWPDASLGCPLPHSNYAQVITPGFSLELEADGGRYAYHTDSLDKVILCQVLPTHEIFIQP